MTLFFVCLMSGSLTGSVLLPLMSFHHSLNDHNINLLRLEMETRIPRMCYKRAVLSAQSTARLLEGHSTHRGRAGASGWNPGSVAKPRIVTVTQLL